MIRKLILLSAMLTIFIRPVFSQLQVANTNAQPTLPTWETYDFMKYGNIGATLYTGTVNYTVPIYNYKDADFTYSLSVDYATNGFRTNQPSGSVGMGWSLSSPGKIVREVNGIPDEVTITVTGGSGVASLNLQGYSYVTKGEYIKTNVCNRNNSLYTCLESLDHTQYYDAQPDTYSFNFNGYSGQFRRDNAKNGRDAFVFYDLSANSRSLTVKSFDEMFNIILQDGNGYEYYFIVESFSREQFSESVGATPTKVVKSWCLDKITAPNGRSVQFRYSNIVEENQEITDNNISYFPTLRYNYSIYANTNAASNSSSTSDVTTHTNKIFNNKFTGVHFPNGESISVRYDVGVPERWQTIHNGDTLTTHGNYQRISTIEIRKNQKTIKKACFTYNVKHGFGGKQNSNRYTFLQSVDITGEGLYTFDYYDMAGYPPLGTTKSDHWGYFNGNNAGIPTTNLLGNLSYDANYNESYSSAFKKNPDFASSLSGTLKKISYPTGGYSTIEYEQHDCSMKLKRDSGTDFIPELVQVQENGIRTNMPVGGIRLKQIINYTDINTTSDTVRYEYTDATMQSLSSGNLINTPRYGLKYNTRSTDVKHVEYFNLTNSMFDYNHTHIEYSHVREIRSDAGYKDYYYTNYQNYPDSFTDASDIKENDNMQPGLNYWNGSNGGTIFTYFNNPDIYVTNILTPAVSQQSKRGLLWREEYYAHDGTLKKRITHSYSFPEIVTDDVPLITGEIMRDIHYPRYCISLDNTTEYDYLSNGTVTTSTDFEYNSLGLVTKKTVTKSNGKTVKDLFYYTCDATSADGVAATMKANGINTSILRQERMEIKDGTETLTEGLRYSYTRPDVSKVRLYRPEKTELWGPSTGWKANSTYSYDDIGLLTQVTDSVGVATSYLWSYSGRYPVMVADNLDFSALNAALGSVGLAYDNLRDDPDPDATVFAKLVGLISSKKDSHFSIYRYEPAAGVSEAVMSNGLKTFYSYDGYRRLTDIRDNDGDVTEHAEYNIVTVLPLTADFDIPASCHINEQMNVSATAAGGTSSYIFTMRIKDQNNNTVYNVVSDNGAFTVMPLTAGLLANNFYTIEVEARDAISDESSISTRPLDVKGALLKYTDISEPVTDMNKGNGSVTANIYTDSSTTITFALSCVCSGTCTITVGNSQYTFTGRNETTFTAPVSAGNNTVKISFVSSLSENSAELTIYSAVNHEIGNPRTLSFSF